MERVKKAITDQALLNCAPQLNGTSEEGKHRPSIAESSARCVTGVLQELTVLNTQ
jgi:hypothetical protein